jgi:hypothetical protein
MGNAKSPCAPIGPQTAKASCPVDPFYRWGRTAMFHQKARACFVTDGQPRAKLGRSLVSTTAPAPNKTPATSCNISTASRPLVLCHCHLSVCRRCAREQLRRGAAVSSSSSLLRYQRSVSLPAVNKILNSNGTLLNTFQSTGRILLLRQREVDSVNRSDTQTCRAVRPLCLVALMMPYLRRYLRSQFFSSCQCGHVA